MLQLYDLNKNKIAGLKNYKDLKVERDLTGDEVLSFLYPQIDSKYSYIKEECYVRTKKNEYVIKEVNIQDDWTEFVGKVNVESLKGTPFPHFETVEQTCTSSINLALAGTGWIIGSCDVTKKRTVRKVNCSSYDILQEIRKVYRCDFKFDAINKKIYIYQSMGSDRGVYFSDKLNLKKLDIQSNSYDFATRIIPIGKDGLKISSINGGKEYVENYQYSTKIITIYWEDNRYTNAQSLMEDAQAKLAEISKPLRAYSGDIFDLANLNDKYKNILDYDLGDTITLLSKDKNVKEKQRIVKLIEYPEEPERNSCDIANKTLSFEDIQAENQSIIDSAESVITSEGMIDNSKVDFNPLRLEVVSLIAEKADIGELNAAVARIGTLETTKANITDLSAAVARIGSLEVGSATITQLDAANAKISTLESQAASINTLLAGNIGVENLQANLVTAESGLIANGAIKDAMILNLSVDKILAGDISTNKFRIVSTSGNMLISDNTIQIKDSTRVRVQIGKDASNDYNMYVWDSSGNLMFDATGLKASGIKSKIIRDDMVSDTANINATKIEKESLVTRINGASTLLLASKVKLDTENQTLEVAFNSLKSTVTTTGNTVTSQGTSISTIQGQIQAKIWQQDIDTLEDSLGTRISSTETSITALNTSISLKVSTSDFNTYKTSNDSAVASKATQSALNTTNGNVSALTTRVTSAESSISVLQNQISLKVEQSDITTAINNINIGGTNLLFHTNETFTASLTGDTFTYMSGRLATAFTRDGAGLLLKKGQVYTIQFEYSITNYKDGVGFGLGSGTKVGGYDADTFGMRVSYSQFGGTNGKVVYSFTYNLDQVRYLSFRPMRIDFGNSGNTMTITISKLKVEKGNKATDYTEAPEDIITYTDTQISTAKAEIKVTTDSISSTVSSVQSSVTSLGTRVTSAESSITSLNNSITLKVNTSDFNSYKTSNDSAVNSKSSQTALNTTNGNLTALTTRVSTAESSISVLQGQIDLKVETSTYTSKTNSLDSSISSLTNRISSAELKITDSAIVSTVRSSTSYTNDLAAKANQSSLNTTNSNVSSLTTRVTNTESSITQLSTQIQSKVNVGDLGTLITQNASSVKIAIGQIGGGNLARNGCFDFETSYWAGWGSGYSSEVIESTGSGYTHAIKIIVTGSNQGRYQDVNGLRVGQTYTFSCLVRSNSGNAVIQVGNGGSYPSVVDYKYKEWSRYSITFVASSATARLFIGKGGTGTAGEYYFTAVKLEEGENATAWTQHISELSNVVTDISDKGLTVRNGAISILNNSGSEVLKGDTSGNLTIRGDFTTYDDTTGNMAMKLSKRSAFFYDFDSNNVCGEIFAGKTVGSNPVRGMVFGAYRNKFLYIACQDSNNNMAPVITVDNGAFGSAGTVSINSGKQINTQNLYVSGSKNCIQDTETYGKRLINAYETAEYFFGDIGSGKLDEHGQCFVYIDEILQECVNTNIEYHVFTQVYNGSISRIERHENYFIVHGSEGTEFSWELKAKRKGFEHVRLEQKFIEEHGAESIEDELKSLASSDIDEELYGDLADELLEV